MPLEGATFISIHAPAKGATQFLQSLWLWNYYFNPRSREGSDWEPVRCQRSACDFNPRSREGSDSKNHQDYSQ